MISPSTLNMITNYFSTHETHPCETVPPLYSKSAVHGVSHYPRHGMMKAQKILSQCLPHPNISADYFKENLLKLYAFSDFHLSGDPPTKPMDIFGENWKNHREKILSAWKETITAGDTVIMAGDISWATHLEDALSDLKTLSALPGRKIIVRGNHDYWWNTVSKMKRMTDNAFEFIFNSALSVENIALAGTRGWIPETSKKITEEDKVIILRNRDG